MLGEEVAARPEQTREALRRDEGWVGARAQGSEVQQVKA